MLTGRRVRAVIYACLVIVLLRLGTGLTAGGGLLLPLAAAASPDAREAPAADCSVPGDYSTIQAAVDNAACTTISVGSGVFTENVKIGRAVTIAGEGAANTEVNGSAAGSVFTIAEDGVATLQGLLITNGLAGSGDTGGGIYNEGALAVSNCVIRDNGRGGVANWDEGTATITDSLISANSDTGGIGNRGELIIENSTIRDNASDLWGGGIWNFGTLTLRQSTIAANTAMEGGGVHNEGGTVTIDSSTLSGNSATFGGGVAAYGGVVTIYNSTISGNSAASSGGGISAALAPPSGRVDLQNSMVVDNEDGGDCAGGKALNSQGYNLDSDNSCNLSAPGDLPNRDPLLGPLQDNGGSTFTHAPLTGSPAIDAGNCPGTAVDQRGYTRPDDAPGVPNAADGCDIGAVEIQYFADVTAGFNATPTGGIAPLEVAFSNLSTGDFNKCLWDFGDRSTSDACDDPLHTYRESGPYTVTLSVDGPGGQDTLTRPDYIMVYEPVQADFSVAPETGAPPLTVQFTNLSTGDYDQCLWDFGDGRTSAACANPTHSFPEEGRFNVSLTVTGAGGADTKAVPACVRVAFYRRFLPGVLAAN